VLLAWSAATALALSGLLLAVDRLVADDVAPQFFAAYAALTGVGSIGLAFVNRRPTQLGPWAWTIMLGWAGHLWAIVWLVNIELVRLPRTAPPATVLLALGALFLAAEALAIKLLRRRLHRAD
jgi:uncharacterized membrane protein HdeD (DUF308 family)